MIPSLDENRSSNTTDRNFTKRDYVATEKIIYKSIGDQKSSWIMNLEENLFWESWIIEAKTTGIRNIKIQMIPLLPPPVLQRMAMEMDWNLTKLGQPFQVLMTNQQKSPKRSYDG